ncbi:MAG TPA: SDR family oxidoreductase [Candidatus Binatia bacterium]|nr:SDR family oxidoreductase [Candidatus Binatia bacterium]
MGLLDDAIAFVTGGGISVGRACVELFLKEGARVAFLDIREDRTKAVMSATGALGYVADIAHREAVVAAVNDAAAKLGGLTVLVNVASVMQGGRVVDTTEAQLDRMFAVNVKGYYWATQAAIPHMLKAGKGSLVQFGSVAATHPAWGESYGIVKASQVALAYQCAMEYAPTIRSNAVLSGWIEDSPASRLLQTIPELIDPILADHPMHRAATSAELAKVCLFLASDLSSSINGETIVADGGQTRTQGNLNALMQKLGPLFAADPDLAARNAKNLAAVTPDELLAK